MTRALRHTGEILRFELGYQLTRASTRLYFAIFVALAAAMSYVFLIDARNDNYYFNAPIITAAVTIVASMFALLVTAGVAGDAATRDAEARLDSLVYTTPLRKASYLGGRFLGAFAVTALLLLGVPIGLLLATLVPGIEPQLLGPFRAEAYLTSYFFFAVPNAFLSTAVLFGLAVLSRRAITSYAGAAFLFFAAFLSESFLANRLGQWGLGKLLDPLAFTTLRAYWRASNPIQRNTLLIGLDGALLSNRLFWLGLALTMLALTYVRFRFAYATGGRGWKRAMQIDEAPATRWTGVTVPAARRVFGVSTRMRQLRAVTARAFRELVTSKGWLIVPLVALSFVMTGPELLEVELGTPGAATTGRVAVMYGAFETTMLIALLITLSAGELVWRERDARMGAIADVTPVPEWLTFLGKFLALALMLVVANAIFLLAGVGVQLGEGYDQIDLALYVKILFGVHLAGFLLIAALAMVIHVLVNQKYVANVLMFVAFVAIQRAPEVGIEHNLLLYGGAPNLPYSEMSGFGSQVGPWLWFTFYWSGWALLFGVLSYLFWIRGEERGLRRRVELARRRLMPYRVPRFLGSSEFLGGEEAAPRYPRNPEEPRNPRNFGIPAAIGAAAVAIIIGAGAFIFYNTNVLNRYFTDADIEQRRVEYERRYGKYAAAPQPLLAATKLHVDFYPERGAATIRGTYRLENRSVVPIDSIHLATHFGVTTDDVSFDRPSRATLTDDDLGFRIYALGRPVQPGESVQLNFRVVSDRRGFRNEGRDPSVTHNGSWIEHRGEQTARQRQWLPVVGYQSGREVSNPGARKKYGLAPRPGDRPLTDVAARGEQRGNERIVLETIVGTSAGQTGVAPGTLRRSWNENGRSYAHYVTEAPINNGYAIYSARYDVQRTAWHDTESGQEVALEIYHHPGHTANLERMVRSARASLDYHTRHYGPYPYKQLRMIEFPSSGGGLGLTAHHTMIKFSEGYALVRPESDHRDIDLPFAVMAHEMGHQWWGHQIVPAGVEGAAVLSESLAWYSGMMVVEQTHGRQHLARLVDVMRNEYLAPHATREVPLLRATDRLDAYRTGPLAMYALRESIGEQQVNTALRNLISKFNPSHPPYPTSLDLYAELRAATPPAQHDLLKDLFEEITFWDLKTTSIDVAPVADGIYRVLLHVDAKKLKADPMGREKSVPMSDEIVVEVFGADGKSLYRAPHRIVSGAQRIVVNVARPPARAGVDPDHVLLDREPGDNVVGVGGRTE